MINVEDEIDLTHLRTLWDDVRREVEAFYEQLRGVPGCQEVGVSICITNGDRLDMFSIPDDPFRSFIADTNHFGDYHSQPPDCLGRAKGSPPVIFELGEECNGAEKGVVEDALNLDVVEDLNTREFRAFMTAVRMRLQINSFQWPVLAKRKFSEICDDPIPVGPGRAHSGKKNLMLMLRLSTIVDGNWLRAVQDEMNVVNICEKVVSARDIDPAQRHTDGVEKSDDGHDKGSDRSLRLGFHIGVNTGAINEFTKTAERATCFDDRKTANGNARKGENHADIGGEAKQDSGPAVCTLGIEEVLVIARNLPRDEMRVIRRPEAWLTLSQMLQNLQHPQSSADWFVQRTEPDGNCLFYSIITAAHSCCLRPDFRPSVAELRCLLKNKLCEVARAGLAGSPFRREWLAFCIHELDNNELREYCTTAFEAARERCDDIATERLLAPLREIVKNWSGMVGSSHWGGLFRVEMVIMATLFGAAIEVLHPVPHFNMEPTSVLMCDTRTGPVPGNKVSHFVRRELHLPVGATLPSVEEYLLVGTPELSTTSGWFGPYPLLRVTLRDRHYDACTSNKIYPAPALRGEDDLSSFTAPLFNLRDTLCEPYAALSAVEDGYFHRALEMVALWRSALSISEEAGRHADNVVVYTKTTELRVSHLSNLMVPPVGAEVSTEHRLSDEIVSCYMSLLEKRANDILVLSRTKGCVGPPVTKYMDSWFYKSISRGLAGPTARRRHDDLLQFKSIIFPALIDGHWLLGVCRPFEDVIGVYDPAGKLRKQVFRVIKSWADFQLPSTSRREWKLFHLRESRGCVQKGNMDCGVYICKAAECLGLGIPIRISQCDIPYVRRRMVVEFICQEASTIEWPRTY